MSQARSWMEHQTQVFLSAVKKLDDTELDATHRSSRVDSTTVIADVPGRRPWVRPSRYGKQIVSHLGRRALGVWSDETNTGAVTFDNGVAVAEFACEEDALTIALRGTAELIPRFESVVGDHLVRFGVRDELIVSWTRNDGSPGSVQRNAPLSGHEPH